MRLLLGLLLFLICLFCGLYVKFKFASREKFISNMIMFVDDTKLCIKFLQTNLNKHFENCIEKYKVKKSFCQFLTNAQKFVISGAEIKKPVYVDMSEWEIVLNFFDKLGKSDVDNQAELCESTQIYLKQKQNEANEKLSKDGSMYLKVLICLGLALMLLVI